MLVLPAGFRIFVATEPVDMRKKANGLRAVAEQHLGEDPRYPSGRVPPAGRIRSIRGGGWFSNEDFCTVSYRNSSNTGGPSGRNRNSGFRLVRTNSP